MRKLFVCAVTAVLMATLPVYAQTGGKNKQRWRNKRGQHPRIDGQRDGLEYRVWNDGV